MYLVMDQQGSLRLRHTELPESRCHRDTRSKQKCTFWIKGKFLNLLKLPVVAEDAYVVPDFFSYVEQLSIPLVEKVVAISADNNRIDCPRVEQRSQNL